MTTIVWVGLLCPVIPCHHYQHPLLSNLMKVSSIFFFFFFLVFLFVIASCSVMLGRLACLQAIVYPLFAHHTLLAYLPEYFCFPVEYVFAVQGSTHNYIRCLEVPTYITRLH